MLNQEGPFADLSKVSLHSKYYRTQGVCFDCMRQSQEFAVEKVKVYLRKMALYRG